MPPMLRIGQLAETTGVPAKTIRYYEEIELLPSPRRTTSGYRQYDASAVERLRFIRRARSLRLPLQQLRTLTGTLNGGQPNALRPRLLALVQEQLSAVKREITELEVLRQQLEQVSHRMRVSAARWRTGACRCLETQDSERPANDERRPLRRA